jgi:1,4-alpha-glucan branching enzyme
MKSIHLLLSAVLLSAAAPFIEQQQLDQLRTEQQLNQFEQQQQFNQLQQQPDPLQRQQLNHSSLHSSPAAQARSRELRGERPVRFGRARTFPHSRSII